MRSSTPDVQRFQVGVSTPFPFNCGYGQIDHATPSGPVSSPGTSGFGERAAASPLDAADSLCLHVANFRNYRRQSETDSKNLIRWSFQVEKRKRAQLDDDITFL